MSSCSWPSVRRATSRTGTQLTEATEIVYSPQPRWFIVSLCSCCRAFITAQNSFERGLPCLGSLAAICFVPDWLFRLLLSWPARPGGAPRRCLRATPEGAFGRGASRRSAARAAALRFRLEVPFRHTATDPARDLGFGYRPGRLCQDRRFRLRQGEVRRLEVAHAESAPRLGRRAAVCARRAS